ncbi:MAG TPA: transglycosylase SLT domain-containing protein [Candidatus Acidoferrum sp.]|nr:transglycosylase SLT domain-containing protein [Candidatus Acidoferrum sp.]
MIFVVALAASVFSLPSFAQNKHKRKRAKSTPCRSGCKPETTTPEVTASSPDDAANQAELSRLARDLRNAGPGAYDRLSVFAGKHAADAWGARAALALGFDDYQKNRAPQSLVWLAKAKDETLLREYVLFYTAQSKRAAKRNAEALKDLNTLWRDYPNSAIKEQVLDVLAASATDAGHPQDAVEALSAYSGTTTKPALLLDRAHAYQVAGQTVRAVKDYQAIFYKYPLSDEAKAAGTALAPLQKTLRSEFPYATAEMQEQRAERFFEGHKWRDARVEFDKLVAMLHDPANVTRQHAQLRLAQCKVQLKGSLSLLSALVASDPEVNAERLFALSQFQRSAKNDSAMFASLDELTQKYPQSKWTEEGYMQAGNYYWVLLDRPKAASYYQKVLDNFPEGKNAYNAQWRVAWVAYLTRQPDADEKLKAFLVQYPVSADASDALYWLGRFSERSGNPAHARTFYNKAIARFPQTYFGYAAADRLSKLGPGEENPAEFLDKIPQPVPLRSFDEPIPPAAADRWARAQALRSIAFDGSAELELKNAFFATGSPRFLVEAAQAAFDQGHFGTGMAYARLAVPSFDSRKLDEVPLSAWRALYPLPYETQLRHESEKNGLDPMIVAGLIRQESTFQADVVSYANAYGLMQLLPKTAKILAKQRRVKYAKTKLFDANYNIELGTYYFKGLVDLTGTPEYALAAYNAGEDRIALWKAERNYEEVPELVESIPFSQTREYVQIVLRNAAMYRMIYPASAKPVASVAQGR